MNRARQHNDHYGLQRRLAVAAAALLLLAPALGTEHFVQPAAPASALAGPWGTYHKPFAVDSLWNSRPVNPVLGAATIPKSNYFPRVGGGKYSLEVFLAAADDPPVTVRGLPGRKGVWDPDWEAFRESITVPRWPRGVTPAEGRDGHADIVDATTGIVHSFNMLRFQAGQWIAGQYAWTRIDGRGWGDPAHYFQGARAAGVPAMGGLIRKHEVRDGDVQYRHALAVSLTFNALASNPAYVFPATSADRTASRNTGTIPEGALLMLPASFDTASIGNAELRKVARTLMTYGAYVVDRNVGTPFNIYVENGADFNLHGRGHWDAAVANDLQRIRAALRPVVAADGWLDANGRAFTPDRNLNLLSMRGPWTVRAGSGSGQFDSWAQAIVFPQTATRIVQVARSARSMHPVSWAKPAAGVEYRLTALATGGARLRLRLRDMTTGKDLVDSGELADGATTIFPWPNRPVIPVLEAISGTDQKSSVSGTLAAVDPIEQRRAQ